MDVTRRTYRRKMRLFEGSDDTVTVRWYFTRPGARPLPYGVATNMDIWRFLPWEQRPIGEDIEDPPKFEWLDAPPTALGQRPCVPDPSWFVNGQPSSWSGPPLARDPFGIPLCCNPNLRVSLPDTGWVAIGESTIVNTAVGDTAWVAIGSVVAVIPT